MSRGALTLNRKDRNGIEYESVVDSKLWWGDPRLTPGEVLEEAKPVGFAVRDRFDDSDPVVGGVPVPMRAKIVAALAINHERERPFKMWLSSSWGTGWLVVEEQGWAFHPQEHK